MNPRDSVEATAAKRPELISLPVQSDTAGRLSYLEVPDQIPFEVARIYYLTHVPPKVSRGGHADMRSEYLVVALAGQFDVVVDDGHDRTKYTLDRSDQGLFIPSCMWRQHENFSDGAVCLVLASERYDASSNILDYDEFAAFVRSNQ